MATAVSFITFLMRQKRNGVVSCVVSVGQDRHLTCNISFGRVGLNIVEEEKKQVFPFVSVSILALVTRHAMRMRRVILLLSITFLHVVS